MKVQKFMRDVLGEPAFVGDIVMIVRTGYREMTSAVVTKITPKGVKCTFRLPRNATFPEWTREQETFRSSEMFVKVR